MPAEESATVAVEGTGTLAVDPAVLLVPAGGRGGLEQPAASNPHATDHDKHGTQRDRGNHRDHGDQRDHGDHRERVHRERERRRSRSERAHEDDGASSV